MEITQILAFLPLRWRPIVLDVVGIFIATQVVASLVVQALPMSAAASPRWGVLVRALHRYAHMRFRDEFGTLKLPGSIMVPSTVTPSAPPPAQVEAPAVETQPAETAAPAPTTTSDTTTAVDTAPPTTGEGS